MIISDKTSIDILEEVINGKRIDKDKAVHIALHADLLDLAVAANYLRNRHNSIGRISYTIDRNLNYTNVCNINCTFCAFCRTSSDSCSYVINYEQLREKAIETKASGGTGFLIQGGVNPDLPWEYYLKLVSTISDTGLWVHGFSPIEIQEMAKISGQNLEKTINDLHDAGLGSIPGGGAEILVDRVRKQIAPMKGGTEQWLEVMEAAHAIGIKTTGTMMFGIIETMSERIEHFDVLRNQQDKALMRINGGSYTAFTAWPFQKSNTIWSDKIPYTTDVEYLRTIALARIYLDNFPHIQSSWVTMGHKTGQMALYYGCDDMGSVMFEENVINATGTSYRMSYQEIQELIVDAGFSPWQRDAIYMPVN